MSIHDAQSITFFILLFSESHSIIVNSQTLCYPLSVSMFFSPNYSIVLFWIDLIKCNFHGFKSGITLWIKSAKKFKIYLKLFLFFLNRFALFDYVQKYLFADSRLCCVISHRSIRQYQLNAKYGIHVASYNQIFYCYLRHLVFRVGQTSNQVTWRQMCVCVTSHHRLQCACLLSLKCYEREWK